MYQDDSTIEKCNNIRLLDEIQESRDEGEEDYVSDKVLTNARGIVANLYEQPMIFRTHRNSIQFEYEMESGSYLEFEIFEERVTCMWIPKGDVKRASFPEVGLNDYNAMNRIVEVFIEDE